MHFGRVKEIEIKYNVEQIRVNGQQVWPLIRPALWAYYTSQTMPLRASSFRFWRVFELSWQFFYGFRFYFKNFDYLCFSDSSERKFINGKWIDKSVDFILENLPSSLLFETPLPRHYKISETATRFIASKLPLYALERIYSLFFLRSVRIENEVIIKEIFAELGIEFDYNSVLKYNLAQYEVGKLLYFLYKPKGVIIQCSYTNTGFVKAFRDKAINVVEVQHGLISSSHEAYNVFKKLDPSYFPNYFLSYGRREVDFFDKSYFLESSKQVIPVGHYYLDLIKSSNKTAKEVIPELLDYSFGVSITGQNLQGVEDKFIDFMSLVAARLPTVCFFYIPRSVQSRIFKVKKIPSNLIIANGRNTYEVIRLTAVHSTIFSTCAIEAIVLGTPNILVNIDNLAKEHMDEIMTWLPATIITNEVEGYLEAIKSFAGQKEISVQSNPYLIEPAYKENIMHFLTSRLTRNV